MRFLKVPIDGSTSAFVKFYLSNQAKYDEGDTFLKQVATGSIKTGTGKAKTLSYSFSAGETASGEFIIAVTDADNTVAESNEVNNAVVSGPIP